MVSSFRTAREQVFRVSSTRWRIRCRAIGEWIIPIPHRVPYCFPLYFIVFYPFFKHVVGFGKFVLPGFSVL